MFQKLSNTLFWFMIYGILGLSIYWIIELIVYNLLNQSLYEIIISSPPLITLLGFVSFGMLHVTTIFLKDVVRLKQ